jgi:hypothetical protein
MLATHPNFQGEERRMGNSYFFHDSRRLRGTLLTRKEYLKNFGNWVLHGGGV